MTITSEVKQCLSSLKNIEASLATLAGLSENDESRKMLYSAIKTVGETAADVQKRIGELEEKIS